MGILSKMKRALRGDVGMRTLALEAWRRSHVLLQHRRERAILDRLDGRPAGLRREFARMPASELLEHFRSRPDPKFLPGFNAPEHVTANLQHQLFATQTEQLLRRAAEIIGKHCWPLLGYGEICFGEEIDYRRDPVSGAEWTLDYHAAMKLVRGDGSDVRVLWELNRLAHLMTLGRAYAITSDERLAAEFFTQVESWSAQNPLGRGVNWSSAMEVALRAINLLAAFTLFRRSPQLDRIRLAKLLALFEHHGEHIRRNLEFSYLSTSNHYLSDVVGLLWLGVMLPELETARSWREMGHREMLREMDKQVLADGADCEASTGYHRFVLELFLYSFILCRENQIEIEEKYWRKLYAMLGYLRAYLRPDGRAPLIGDTDGGQVLPLLHRPADDHAYLLALGATVFNEPRFRDQTWAMPEELLWVLGEQGVRDYENLEPSHEYASSQAFPEAGTYILRESDLYLLFNASGSGLYGRGSHGHNDALSLEVHACGRLFIVDPGTYVYTSDFHARHLFRSTAYHSTVEIDGAEQNTTDERTPFIIGDEAHPRVLCWETTPDRDTVVAEHDGYKRLAAPVTHRRSVRFNKRERFWAIDDVLLGEGEHILHFRFQLASALETSMDADSIALVWDRMSGARLMISALDVDERPELEARFMSRDYGQRSSSVSLCWTARVHVPAIFRWVIVPVCASEDENERRAIIARLRNSTLKSEL